MEGRSLTFPRYGSARRHHPLWLIQTIWIAAVFIAGILAAQVPRLFDSSFTESNVAVALRVADTTPLRSTPTLTCPQNNVDSTQGTKSATTLGQWTSIASSDNAVTEVDLDATMSNEDDESSEHQEEVAAESELVSDLTGELEIRIPYETGRERAIIVPVRLTGPLGVVETKLYFDTGATMTMIDHATARELGLEALDRGVRAMTLAGPVDMPTALLDRVTLGDLEERTDLKVGICTACAVGEVHGLLGLDFMKRYRITIDTQTREIILTPHAMF